MIALIRSELLVLRSLRSTYVLAAGLLALTVGMTVADLSEIGKPTMDSPAELREPMVAGAGIVTAIFLALMAAVRVGGEYRYATIGQRLLATPARDRLLAARVATYAALGTAVAGLVFAATAAATLPMVDAEGLSLGLSGAHVARLAAEAMLSTALLAAIGVAVGVLARSQTAAILALGGAVIGERILTGLLGPAGAYLPTSLMDSLVENQGAQLRPGVAGLVLAAIAAGVALAARRALSRRDVT